MVDISRLHDLSIYTDKGFYVGSVVDVVLNIKQGRVSKLKVRALEQDKNMGFTDLLRTSVRIVPEDDIRSLQESAVRDIDYSRVLAVGDIMIIDSAVIEKKPPVQAPPQTKEETPREL